MLDNNDLDFMIKNKEQCFMILEKQKKEVEETLREIEESFIKLDNLDNKK